MNNNYSELLNGEDKCEGCRPKEYIDVYKKMVETATRHFIRSIREFGKHWSWQWSVEEGFLRKSNRTEEVMGISRTATKVWTLLFMKKTVI